MIVFDLECAPQGHRFEGWFSSSSEFEAQQARGLVTCPHCGSDRVSKAVMAPAVGRKGNQLAAMPASQAMSGGRIAPEVSEILTKLAELQAATIKDSRWVGESFAEVSRAMHYGERDSETVHGQATLEEAKALLEEGVPVMPLPFPVAPPDKLN